MRLAWVLLAAILLPPVVPHIAMAQSGGFVVQSPGQILTFVDPSGDACLNRISAAVATGVSGG